MENVYAIIGMVLTLIIGLFAGMYISTDAGTTESESPICPTVEAPVCAVAEPVIVTENITITKDYLSESVAIFMKAVEDEEDEDGNDVDVLGDYDFDEVSIKKVYDDYTVSIDDDKTVTEFSIKLKFKEDGESSTTETYDVKVITEDDEDTKVILL